MRKEMVSDCDLISQYQQGNENALRILINRHKTQVFSTILLLVKDRYLAEDIFQDTFLKVVNTLKHGQYTEQGKFLPWVTRIARNLVIDHFRKTNKMPMITDQDGFDVMSNLPFSEDNRETTLMEEQTNEKIRNLIQHLPAEQREVLVLRHYADLSFKEIADITNVSINTALGRMRYALNNLRKIIEKHQITL